MPSTWYEIHLSGGGYEVSGASLPGMPMVLIGQNRRIAWGITALLADVQDLYLETPNPENPRQYAAPEGFRDLEVVADTIPVKDGSAATEEVRSPPRVIVEKQMAAFSRKSGTPFGRAITSRRSSC
jgi:penicillin amidase